MAEAMEATVEVMAEAMVWVMAEVMAEDMDGVGILAWAEVGAKDGTWDLVLAGASAGDVFGYGIGGRKNHIYELSISRDII